MATWTLVGMGAVATVLGPMVFAAAGQSPAAYLLPAALPSAFLAAGAVAALQRPDHLAVQRLLGVGALHTTAFALSAVVVLQPDAGGAWVLNLVAWLAFSVGFASYVGMFAVFPDGRYHRSYECWVTRGFTAAALLLPSAVIFSAPTAALVIEHPTVTAVPVWSPWLAPLAAVEPALFTAPLVGVVLFALRYRRASGVQRMRMRWPLLSAVLGGVAIGVDVFLGVVPEPAGGALVMVAVASLPVTLVVGMLRHQLLDVDMVIHRSLVYGVLWTTIAAMHIGAVAVLGLAAGQRASIPVTVGVTLAAATAFQPARRRLERLADRIVHGRRADGYQLVRSFGARLADALPAESLDERIAHTITTGLDAAWTRVTFGDEGLPEKEEQAAHIAPLTHRDQRLGAILVGPKRTGDYTPSDLELLDTLARQAALAVRNAHLAGELNRRLDELAASRRRLVAAQDDERRRIERDLHDGIQQELVAMLATAELARLQHASNHGDAHQTLTRLQNMIRQTQDHLRGLVRGIHPAVLTDRGVVAAIEARASQLPMGVRIDADAALWTTRYPPLVEAAAYFFASEGITNAVKHSGAGVVEVTVRVEAGGLVVAVSDDGVGFEPAAVNGTGLAGLRDRLDAVGGSLRIESSAASGARLIARIPVAQHEHV